MVDVKHERVTALPSSPTADTMYVVKGAGEAMASLFVSGTTTTPVAVGSIFTTTWTALNALATAAYPGRIARVTDIGVDGGSLWVPSGALWAPIAPICLERSVVAGAALSSTTEDDMRMITIRGGLLGLNRRIHAKVGGSFGQVGPPAVPNTGSGVSKAVKARFSGNTTPALGTAYLTTPASAAGNVSFYGETVIAAMNATNAQKGLPASLSGNGGFSSNGFVTSSVNTSNDSYIHLTHQVGALTDYIMLEWYEVWLLP